MISNWVRRVLSPVVQFRESEFATGLMMFAYSFLAMTAYNVIKPITRSNFISSLGADNLPYVQLAAGLLIGVLMQGYSVLVARLPRRYVAPLTLAGMSGLLVAFWLLFRTAGDWVSVAFYLIGLILGILLISQFWTLANDIYDARQAKRVFGFIGGGSSLGGMTGAGLTALVVSRLGTENLLLCSAGILLLCAGLVGLIVRREEAAGRGGSRRRGGGRRGRRRSASCGVPPPADHRSRDRLRRGRRRPHRAAAEHGGGGLQGALVHGRPDRVPGPGGSLPVGHRVLHPGGSHDPDPPLPGRGLRAPGPPDDLGATGIVMLLNAALSAPALARILDTSLRYTLDKTTREILFLPLPTALKYRAKPFVDVTVDRFAKGLAALLALVLIKPWAWGSLAADQLASLAVIALWVVTAIRRGASTSSRSGEHRAARGGGLAARPTWPIPRRWRRWSRSSPIPTKGGPLCHRYARGFEPSSAGDAAPPSPPVGEGAGAGPPGVEGGPARAAGPLGGHRRADLEGRERRCPGGRGPRSP